jgi:hypothetical protein
LYNTGRGGLSVAQGGGMGAANPEMQALANARALQDLQLASQAQQAGQQNVTFGAGLFNNAGTLEQLAQQPLSLSSQLGGLSANYGGNAGRLGLTGTLAGATYGTNANATTNPLAYLLSGLGSPTSTLGAGFTNLLGNYLGGNTGYQPSVYESNAGVNFLAPNVYG